MVDLAGDVRIALDESTEDAGQAKADLDGSISTAGTAKSTLDGTIVSAGSKKTELEGAIGSADTKINEITNPTDGTIKQANDAKVLLEGTIVDAGTAKGEIEQAITDNQIVTQPEFLSHKLDYTNQRAIDNLKVATIDKELNDYKSTLSSVNVNQEATQTATGYGVVSLPKNAANGQVSGCEGSDN